MDMNAAWLTPPVTLTGMRMFECGDLTTEECDYYKQHWHFWYIADYVFALPTVAFFMSGIGIFVLSFIVSSLFFGHRISRRPHIGRKLIAGLRYLSYRGFHVRQLRWNSAPVGVLLLGTAGAVFFFCMVLAPKPYYWPDEKFGGSPPLATRSGWLSLACMPFVFATASKANWITLLTGVSHERLQVFHRWIAYAFFILALLHTFPFIVYHVHWHDMKMHFSESLLFYWTGIVAIIFQAWLTFMSQSTIRALGYEFFKVTHFASVVVFMLTFFWHCDYTLTSWHYFIATAAIYVPCFVFPWLRTVFEYKWAQQAKINVEDNGFIRITIPVTFQWIPGQHCFLRFTSFGLIHAFSAHPFTICSTPSGRADTPSELVFYIRHLKGFTAKLYQQGLEHPGLTVPVLIDGPYGGINFPRLRDADRLLVIAGGSGAGWSLPFIEHFVDSASTPVDEEDGLNAEVEKNGTPVKQSRPRNQGSKPTSLRVILATRETSSRIWFEHTVAKLFTRSSSSARAALVQVQVYLTGTAAEEAVTSTHALPHSKAKTWQTSQTSDITKIPDPSTGIATHVPGSKFEGRPELPLIVREEAGKAAEAGERLCVYVCGPDTMLNDVRNAVARENWGIVRGGRGGGVYLHTEHFSWA